MSLLFYPFLLTLAASGCSIVHTRPIQHMSDTSAALKAAREVQADTLSPELYRQANEYFDRAKYEYKLKNFERAETLAVQARRYAEQAEFEAIRGGASRASIAPPLNEGGPKYEPYDYPAPTGIPAADYDQRVGPGAPQNSTPPSAPTPPAPADSPPMPTL